MENDMRRTSETRDDGDDAEWQDRECSIETLRRSIEEMDGRMIELLDMRAGLARRIGSMKRRLGLPLLDERREGIVLSMIESYPLKNLPGHGARRIFEEIIAHCRGAQERDDGCEHG